MNCLIIKCLLTLMCLWQKGNCVRVSPKLDFGTDSSDSDNRKIRPVLQSRFISSSNHEHNKSQNFDISCATGNCNLTGIPKGISTDVVVNVKTNVNLDAEKSSTKSVPDIPIIVGTKTDDLNFNVPNSFNSLPPFPLNILVQNGIHQTRHHSSGSYYPDYPLGNRDDNYTPDLYSIHNSRSSNRNPDWNPYLTENNPKHLNNGISYNPVQFRKVYPHPFPLQMQKLFSSIDRKNPSIGAPCICQNPQTQYYQNNYPHY